MAKITRKNATTAIKLSDLLRKRKITLSKFIVDFGLHSYESLKTRCERIGVAPPDIETYKKAKGSDVINSPTDGIIVLDFPKIIDEKTGEEISSFEERIDSLEKSDDEFESTEESNDNLIIDNVVHLSGESKKNKKKYPKSNWDNSIVSNHELKEIS
jgi:hypothetical protein